MGRTKTMGFCSESSGSLRPSALRALTLCAWVATAAVPTSAQVSNYLFRSAVGTYTPITGGTVLASGNWNNGVYTVSLPSPFWFNGTSYTDMHVSCNGFVTFGAAPSPLTERPLSSSESYAGAVAPFACNLWRSGQAGSSVSWAQVGREVVVQWAEVRRFVSANTEHFSFQARLDLDSGRIRFVYGPSLNVALNHTVFPQVGLRGENNTFPANVNNRHVNGTNWWGTSVHGADNLASCRYTSKNPARQPSQGLTFTYGWNGGMELELETDAMGAQTSWQIIPGGGGAAICGGGGYPNSTTQLLACVTTAGQYRLVVSDAAGDGMCCSQGSGGYVLRNLLGDRIIDNRDDGTFTLSSTVTLPFDLPLGTDHLVDSLCDREDLFTEDAIQAQPDADVRAQFGVTNTTSGYQWWFYDPDGGYSRRLFMSHSFNNYQFISGPDRCSFLRLGHLQQSPLPLNVLLNVKVRSRVAGTNRPWGPACRLRIDLPNQCPVVQLVNNPSSPLHSCGLTNVLLNGSTFLHATLIPTAHKYKFRFAAPNYVRNITSNSSSILLQIWGTAPLQYGNKVYQVQATTSYDNGATWCPFGPACTITTAASAPGMLPRSADADGGTAQVPDTELRAWPNPLSGSDLQVNVSGWTEGPEAADVMLMDAMGRTVWTGRIPVAEGRSQASLPLQHVPSGQYALVLRAGGQRLTERVVIE